jgi:uncharacterized protein YecE (DUF72 family)
LESWSEATPADFSFAVKAHQRITHIKRLKDVTADISNFLDSHRPVASNGKLGPVLFHLPPFLASFAYYRFRKSEYSETALHQLESRLTKAAKKCEDVYAFLKHEETLAGAVNARKFVQNLGNRRPSRRIAS